MMKTDKYHKLVDHLTVISEVIYLCLDGTLGKLSDQQKENLNMAQKHVWLLHSSLGNLLHIKSKKVYKKF